MKPLKMSAREQNKKLEIEEYKKMHHINTLTS